MTSQSYRIVYVGPLAYGQTSMQRLEALKALGHCVAEVNTFNAEIVSICKKYANQLWGRLFGPLDRGRINDQILEMVAEHHPEILWIDKGLIIDSETLLRVKEISPKTIAVSYSPDDMMNPNNQSKQYLQGVPLYDLHVTTKSFNVAELKVLGARAVIFVNNAYCPFIHQPRVLTPKEKILLGGPVGFIGTYEKERADILVWLAQQDIPVKIWGRSWPRRLKRAGIRNLKIMGAELLGKEYSKAICAFDINLGFLCKKNRDLQTTRSIEIPACGAFLLAERTTEHQTLFQEGQEAEFFDSPDELLTKIRYYLDHEEDRRRIAAAGMARCLKSGYSNLKNCEKILNHCANFCYPVDYRISLVFCLMNNFTK